VKARWAGGAGVASMTMVMARITWAAVMADGAIAKDGMTMAVAAGDDAFAIHGGTAGATAVREAAAGAVAVIRLRTGRSKDSKTGGDSEEGDELFHEEWWFGFF